MNEVYVVSAVRTAIGTFGGSLKDIPPVELASRVTAEAVRRASVAPADIGYVVFGQGCRLSRATCMSRAWRLLMPAFRLKRRR